MTADAATGATVTPTITPNTGLTNGAAVTFAASGLTASSIGNILECNSDSSQPQVKVGGIVNNTINVSCIAPSLQAIVTVNASGSVSATFHVIEGTVGPPCGPAPAAATCPATDSAGQSPTADAALYPCPPTAAQQAKGDDCTLTFGDEANDSAEGTITFASTAPASTTPPTTAPVTATTKPPTTTPTTVAPVTGATAGDDPHHRRPDGAGTHRAPRHHGAGTWCRGARGGRRPSAPLRASSFSS